jgi:hypothetical protein
VVRKGEATTEIFSKFDRPDIGPRQSQPYYHLVFGEGEGALHLRVPDPIGYWLEPFFDHPEAMSKSLAVLGIAMSAYNIWTAYSQDTANGAGDYHATKIAVTKELFSWGGAIAGAEAGAAIGTVIFPGVGTVVGGFVGGAIGAFGGEQIGTWAGEELFGSSISYGGYAVYGLPVGRPNLRPL